VRSSGDGTAVGGPYPFHGSAADHSPKRPMAVQGSGEATSENSEQIGYRGPTACAAAGITYRQLDYWARTGLVEPSVRATGGSGLQRLYSFRDVVVLKIVKRLLDTGVSLQNIRTTVQHLRQGGYRDLERMTLMSDGATVYECTSPAEVHELLQGGQGVFGIAVSGAMQEIKGTIHEFTPERADGGVIETVHDDELTARRKARNAG